MKKLPSSVSWLRHLTVWRVLFVAIVAAGLYATVVRFAAGLGAATNLSDAFPWGLWIGFDVLVGVGLAAGGFVIAATVHVFGLRRYEPIARPAVLTAFLGYLLVIVALMFDLGLPWRIWHPLVMWNPHSVMFEVAWCVMLYTTVLALEFSPVVLERFGLTRPLRWVRAVYMPLVIAGVLLSTMHQSSLGTLYVIAPDKLHPLWYSPLLPWFFLLSAIAGGLAMTIFESFMSRRAFGKHLESELLRGLGRVAVVVLGVYAVWRLQDLAGRGAFGLIFRFTPESVMFWGEMGLGVLLPIILFAWPAMRRNESVLLFAATLTIVGFIVNRLNVAITGMAASSGVSYVPSWMEFAVTTMIVAIGFLAFRLAVQHLPVFPAESPAPRPAALAVAGRARPVLGRGMLVALWSLLAVGVFLLQASVARESSAPDEVPSPAAAAALAPASLELPPPFAFARGATSPGPVVFRHESHATGEPGGCARCHQELYSLLLPGTPLSGAWSYERIHAGDLCGSCHDGVSAFSAAEACAGCHAME